MKREVDGNKVEVGGEGRDRSNTLLKCCHAAFRLKKKIYFMILKRVAMFFFCTHTRRIRIYTARELKEMIITTPQTAGSIKPDVMCSTQT